MTSTTDKSQRTEHEERTCFVIMPIADMSGYESGHFNRVYTHLIKTACDHAGFKPIRADEVTSSNFIVLDILKRIVECDIAICDLSGRNPNVMYELGLRQAFNKKTVLIKDDKTISPFDVQAFRYCEYDSSMRIDNAQNNTMSISKALTSTFSADENDVNSIVQLLKIQPAQVGEKTVLSQENTLILKAIRELEQRVTSQDLFHQSNYLSKINKSKYSNIGESLSSQLGFYPPEYLLGNFYHNAKNKEDMGILTDIIDSQDTKYLVFRNSGRRAKRIAVDSPVMADIIEEIPF